MIKCKHTEEGYCHADECKGCDHKDTSIVVLEIVKKKKKTALQCDYCGKIITEPKTDCR